MRISRDYRRQVDSGLWLPHYGAVPSIGELYPPRVRMRPLLQLPISYGGVFLIPALTQTFPTSSATAATSINYNSLTVGSNSNQALVVLIGFDTNAPTGVAVTWDSGGTNQACTLIVSAHATDNTRSELWGLVNPTQGNKTLNVSWTNSAEIQISACVFANVNQTGGTTTFPHSTSATGTSASPSLTILAGANQATIDTMNNGQAGHGTAPTQVLMFGADGSGNTNFAGSYGIGPGSTTHGWTIPSSHPWVEVGCAIQGA